MQFGQGITRAGVLLAALAAASLAGCATIAREQLTEGRLPPVLNPVTCINQTLRDLPPPSSRAVVAVYGFTDQTGQMKPSDNTQSLSKAVTQGATSVLIKALQDTSNGAWFTVVERERLDNLLKERRIVQEMRKTYLGEEAINPKALPALLFAGILLEGGIIGFDSNLMTGGAGARLLGIGGDAKFRLDTVTIYLRAISTKTGQVLASVTTHKSIASYGIQAGVFRYVAVDRILEAEAGITRNEPDQIAVQQAVEKAVYALVMEGADQRLWAFNDKAMQDRLLDDYRTQQFSSPEAARAYAESAKANAAVLAANEEKAKAVALAQQEKEKAEAEKTAAANAATEAPGAANSGAAAKPGTAAKPGVPAKTGDASPPQGTVRQDGMMVITVPATLKKSSAEPPPSWPATTVAVKETFGHSVNSY